MNPEHNKRITSEQMARADGIAQQLLGLPMSDRLGQLSRLKRENAVLHALVSRRIQDIRDRSRP